MYHIYFFNVKEMFLSNNDAVAIFWLTLGFPALFKNHTTSKSFLALLYLAHTSKEL